MTVNKGGQGHTKPLRHVQWWQKKPLTMDEEMEHNMSYDEFGILRPSTSDVADAANIIMTLNRGDIRTQAHAEAMSPHLAEHNHSNEHAEDVVRSNSPALNGALPSIATTFNESRRPLRDQAEIVRPVAFDEDATEAPDEDTKRHDGDIDLTSRDDIDEIQEETETDSSANKPRRELGAADHSPGDLNMR